jgi:hypothetical protein
VKCSDVQWTDVIYVKLFWSEMAWSTVNVGDKSARYIMATLYWRYLVVLGLFYLVFILYCVCFNLCNVWVLYCVGYLLICVLVFAVFCIVCTAFCVVCTAFCVVCTAFCVVCTAFFVLFRLCILILMCFVCISVRTIATEWQVNFC